MNKVVVLAGLLLVASMGGCRSAVDQPCACCGERAKLAEEAEGRREETISLDRVPEKVREAFGRDYPGAAVGEVEKESYKDGTVQYQFKFTDSSGRKRGAKYSAAGEKLAG